jgi:hypothetical protein
MSQIKHHHRNNMKNIFSLPPIVPIDESTLRSLSPGWQFIDGKQCRGQYDTWDRLSEYAVDYICDGWLVKIGVSSEKPILIGPSKIHAERFWCRVEQNNMTNGIIVRVVQSDMLFADLHGIHHDDLLRIDTPWVMDVQLSDKEWCSLRSLGFARTDRGTGVTRET